MSENEQLLKEIRKLFRQRQKIDHRIQEIKDKLWEIDLQKVHEEELFNKQEEVLSIYGT